MSFRVLLLIYTAILATEIYANAMRNFGLHLFSKPALMLILIFYYSLNARKLSSAKFSIIAALILSWFGDVFLLFDETYKSYFIYGLSSFLFAHISYIFYFIFMRKIGGVRNFPNIFLNAGIVIYVSIFLTVLASNVNSLFVPLGVYAIVISAMLIASLAAFDFGENSYGKICVAGTFLFVASDSILAINRFVAPLKFAPFFIMLTYAAAQVLITEGSLRNLKEIKKVSPNKN